VAPPSDAGIPPRDRSRRAALPLQALMEADPAFGALALWMRHADAGPESGVEAPAWTDGRTIHYGPAFDALTPREKIGVVCHQIMHVAFRHMPRARRLRRRLGEEFDPLLWNLATDAIVNETLTLARITLPQPCALLSELLASALGEAAPPEEAVGRWDAETLYLRLTRSPEKESGVRRARAYAAAKDFRPDLDAEAMRLGDDADDGEGQDGEWAQRIAMAAAGSRRGVLGRRIADLPQVRTPWEKVLRTKVARAVVDAPRPTMSRPARRWIAMDARARAEGAEAPGFEPGTLRRTDRPLIAVGVDVSTSIPEALLRRFAAEIAAIGRRTGAEVHVLVFDEAVLSETRMSGARWEVEAAALSFGRGGGTSFVEVVDRIAALGASIGVVLTDLVGPFGPAPRRTPIVWAIPDAAPPPGCAPPFGDVLSLAR
jgi:predicted metal-dependent peptidase